MENNKRIKQFNRRLIFVLMSVVAIFATLLVAKANAESQIQSLKQSDRENPTILTLDDLNNYYDILCCQKGTPLPSGKQVILSGSHSQGSFSYDMGDWASKGYGVGSIIESHNMTSAGNDFNKSKYQHKTYGYYSIKEQHVCTPHEAYIISEMKRELNGGPLNDGETDVVFENGQPKTYDGNLINSISYEMPSGENIYTVNQRYVLKTNNNELYYVKIAKDSGGNPYYLYETDSNGNLVKYNGAVSADNVPMYEVPGSGEEVECLGVSTNEVFYYDGTSFTKGTVYPSNGTLYIVEYDIVTDSADFVDNNSTPTEVSTGVGTKKLTYADAGDGINSYIQIAWWSTEAGGEGKTVAPNALSGEALAFQDYINEITGGSYSMAEQSYSFTEADGTASSGSVPAPVINYNPGFDDSVGEATVSFEPDSQKYVVGPFAINYVKQAVEVSGRPAVTFAGITGVELTSNLGELQLGNQWNFKFLADQTRDMSEGYAYPNPGELFYIEINYIEGLTEINKFKFDFKYMNAGARVDIYDGNYNIVTWTPMQDGEESPILNLDGTETGFTSYNGQSWLQCTSIVSPDVQTLAHGLIGARWYEYTSCEKEFGVMPATITIHKETVNEAGELVPVDKTFLFKVYINGNEFQEITVNTVNGVGQATSNKIVWDKNGAAPTYEVVEVGEYANNGPWSGTLVGNTDIAVYAKNVIAPKTGTLQLDKKLLNPTPALEEENFKFRVVVTGEFGYAGGSIIANSASEPLVLDVDIHGAGSWTSEEFKWYDDAPSYRITEVIPDGANYELVSGIVGGVGTLNEGSSIATATNQPTTDWTEIEIDKKLVSETTPQPGEVFKFNLTIDGKFWYDDEWIEGTKTFENIELNQDNGWTFKSQLIVWKKGQVPTYTIKEVEMAEGTEFLSITDEKETGLVNGFTGNLQSEKTRATITNERTNKNIGKIEINKYFENNVDVDHIDFKVTINGKFKYHTSILNDETTKYIEVGNGINRTYTVDGIGDVIVDGETLTMVVPVKIEPVNNKYRLPIGEWTSDIFEWAEEADAPKYTVEEINIPDGIEFVSISNGEKVSTSVAKVSGQLEGRIVKSVNQDANAKKVVVTCIDKKYNPDFVDGRIVIVKESNVDEALKNWPFYFKVVITGKFKYYKINPDGSEDPNPLIFDADKDKAEEKLVLNGKLDGVVAYCDGEDWLSGRIEWDKNGKAPEYEIQEIEIPDGVRFVSIQNRIQATNGNHISGKLQNGTEYNYIIAHNTPDEDFHSTLEIVKKYDTSDIKGKIYLFNLKLEGNFKYGGKTYNNENPLIIENIEVEAGGMPFILGQVIFDENEDAPKYTVQEVGALNDDGSTRALKKEAGKDVEFVSIQNDTYMMSVENGITGKLSDEFKEEANNLKYGVVGRLFKDENKTVQVIAINTGKPTTGSHIEISKEVLHKDLKNEAYYFDVKVESDSPFKYHDLEDYSNVTDYLVDETTGVATIEFKDVVAIADGEDWISGYFEWDEGASVPRYTVTENIRKLPEGVEAISISNNVQKIVPEKPLTNMSSDEDIREFKVEGKLNGDLTHIIAINDKHEDNEKYVGKLQIDKYFQNNVDLDVMKFNVEVNGTFKFYAKFTDGIEGYIEVGTGKDGSYDVVGLENVVVTGNKLTMTVPVQIQKPNAQYRLPIGSWTSNIFVWEEGVDAPTYTVKEDLTGLPANIKFVSISNNETSSSSEPVISGKLNGVLEKEVNNNIKAEKVVVTCINKVETETTEGRIVIIKETNNENLNGEPFYFKVTITGKFNYYRTNENTKQNELAFENMNGSEDKTLVLNGEQDNVVAYCGGEDWISGIISWDKNGEAPKFTVEEIDLPNDAQFVCLKYKDQISNVQKIEGVVEDNVEYTYITAINTTGKEASLKIFKKALTADLVGKTYVFDLKLEGNFKYNGKNYTDGNPLEIKGIQVVADGPSYSLGKVTDFDKENPPKYTVQEVGALNDDGTIRALKDDEFVSIENERYMINNKKEISGTPEISKDEAKKYLKGVVGYLDAEKVVKVTARNEGDTTEEDLQSHLQITKTVDNINEDKDILGKEFYFNVVIQSNSNFKHHYDKSDYSKFNEYGPGNPLVLNHIEVIAGGQDYETGIISWDKGAERPTYTVTEIISELPDDVEALSIKNDTQLIRPEKPLTNKSSQAEINEFKVEGTLIGDVTHIICVNKKHGSTDYVGKIQIDKYFENNVQDLTEIKFNVEVNGTFKYLAKLSDGTEGYIEVGTGKDGSYNVVGLENVVVSGNKLTMTVPVKVEGPNSKYRLPICSWTSNIFVWDENAQIPTYKVTEVLGELPEDVKFVSISNGTTSSSDSNNPSVTGQLKGVATKEVTADVQADRVVVTCTNKIEAPETTEGRIVIIKRSDKEALDGHKFEFKVTITGDFKYYNVNKDTNESTLYWDTAKNGKTLVLEGEKDRVIAYCGGEDWISGRIEWEKGKQAPKFTVEEINIPEDSQFVSMEYKDIISYETTISGTVESNVDYTYITANNTTDVNSSLIILKKFLTNDIAGKTYLFNLRIEGNFTYQGNKYTANKPLEIKNIQVVAGGSAFSLGEVTDFDKANPPKYTVEEVGRLKDDGTVEKLKDGEFVSIENEKYMINYKGEITSNPENGITVDEASKYSRGVVGYLAPYSTVRVTARNKGDDTTDFQHSHLQITKEVDNATIKGRTFLFDAEIWSESEFWYHYDQSDYSKIKVYKPGEKLEIKDIPVIADGKDWESGIIEWAKGSKVPQYKVTENIKKLPIGVKALSINNDMTLYRPDEPLTCSSSDEEIAKFKVEGSLIGDVTHVIGKNSYTGGGDKKFYRKIGTISIDKKANSELIAGEEFTFTVNINGKFKYYETLDDFLNDNGTSYTDYTETVKIFAKGDNELEDGKTSKWNSGIISWYTFDSAPTYTVTEETAQFYDGTEFVCFKDYKQSTDQPTISGIVDGVDVENGALQGRNVIPDNWITAENTWTKDESQRGKIQIKKVLKDAKGNEIQDVEFNFKLTVMFRDKDGNYKFDENGNQIVQVDNITVKSGETKRTDWYYWGKNEQAPEYIVEELDTQGYDVEIKYPDNGEKHYLEAQDDESVENPKTGIVTVEADNTIIAHKAWVEVNKHLILNDKKSEKDVTESFKAIVKVTAPENGTFTYNGNAYSNGETLTINVTLNRENKWKWKSDEIDWVGDVAPTASVEEPQKDIPVGWKLNGITSKNLDENGRLIDEQTAIFDITNELTPTEEIILTMKIGGKVWDDTNRNIDKSVDSKEDGKIGEKETGIANVKVIVYRTFVNKANGNVEGYSNDVYVYNENNVAVRLDKNWTYTDDNGNWSFGAISVPAFVGDEKAKYGNYSVTYGVKFEYDGQTYEPTEFLADVKGQTMIERANTVINSSTSERDEYLDRSMAIDNVAERNAFNEAFSGIQGKEPMDGQGNTLGQTESGKELHYTSKDQVSFFNSDVTRKDSTLETRDNSGYIYNDLITSAYTTEGGLSYPYYNHNVYGDVDGWHLQSWDKSITDVYKTIYKYEAVYNYCLSINLGLIEREPADIAVEKDLTEALVVVNGKALKYEFNEGIDFEDPDYSELLYKQLAVANAEIEYKLGLYKGDYYYRAEVYNSDNDVENELYKFYTKIFNNPSYSLKDTELEIYLKYTINVYNQSETYDVGIEGLADYYDSTFTLINAPETKYVRDLNGKEVDKVIEVAGPSTVKYFKGPNENGTDVVVWNEVGNSMEGSDTVTYNKLTTSSLNGKKLGTGEKAQVTVTFKVNKGLHNEAGIGNIPNAIELGKKHNVAEVTKFTSYYSESSNNRWGKAGQVAGRVDEDSAPDNINIKDYNEKAYYEDDTDSAPIITIGLNSENESRKVSGIVWDDAQTKDVGYGQVVGDGIYNSEQGDKLIGGLTTEIYEAISIPTEDKDGDDTVYEEYLFAYNVDEKLADLGGHSLKELTGFEQSIVTDENGGYQFINMPAGNYKVRYVYGDKEIFTGNKNSMVVYNGQDFKTTAYQIGFDNDTDNDGYLNNEWHDISNEKLNSIRVNDARDDEARRLYISAESEMLTHDNSKLLATADSKTANHDELYGTYNKNNPVKGDGYYMYAETAKINLGIENVAKVNNNTDLNGVQVGVVDGTVTEKGKDVSKSDFTYNIKNIDCGIEERSQTKITLDKQIKQITFIPSNNENVLDIVYDIDYTLKEDGTIASTVTINKEASTNYDHISSLNRNGNNQGYRYIISEGQMLQGAVIKVKYQFTIFNMSETDRISQDLDTLWTKYNSNETSVLDSAMKKVSTNLYTNTHGRVYNDGTGFAGVGYGTYFGSVYYLGSQGVGLRADETIVKTKVHQMIDYIDPDVEFTDMDNISRDQSWANTDAEYLLNNHLIAPSTVQILDKDGKVVGTRADREKTAEERYSIISDKLQEYKTDNKNNLVLTIDNNASGDTGTNPGFVKFLEPYMANKNKDKSTGAVALFVSRSYSSELDASDIDNLAEIIQVENTAGRRDSRNIAGNANPYQLDGETPVGIFAVAQGREKDASATEVITLSPPTGLNANESRTMQLLIVILISVTLVAVAIVVIKKKVLIKK